MADSKITALTALSAAPASGDFFVIVDVSDTTMSASGTNKKLAASYLLNAAGTVTGATSQAQAFTSGVTVGSGTSGVVTINASSSQMVIQRSGTQRAVWNAFDTTLDIDHTPANTDSSLVRFFRQTDTSGTKQVLLLAGDNTTTVVHQIGVNTATVFNEQGSDLDFRIEGDTDTSLFYVDASTDRIGIGTNTPSAKLHVSTTLLVGTSTTSPIVYGSSVANGDLILEATSNATKTSAYIIMQPNGGGGVGIGTSAPVNPLHIADASTGGANFSLECTDTGGARYLWSSTGSASAPGAGGLEIFKAGVAAPNRFVLNYSGSNVRLGVGVTNPSSTLDIGGAGVFSGSISAASDTNTTSYLGRAAVGYNGTNSDYATFAHIDQNSGTNAALMQTSGGITILNCATGQYMALAVNATIQYYMDTTAFYPFTDDAKDLGQVSNRWDDVYATNGTIQTSDERKKKYIADSDLGLAFIERLRPVRYVWRQHKRRHYGLIAQEVKAALDDIGIADFAGYIHDEDADAYGLRYSEFIAPLIKAVQELRAEVNALREQGTG